MSHNNLHSYWSSRHRNDMAENSICQKREREEQRRQSFKENYDYFLKNDLVANTYAALEDCSRPSSSYKNRNEESRTEEIVKEIKERKISERKQRLATFLISEQKALEHEAKEKQDLERQSDPWSMKSMKERLEILRKEKEVEELQLAEKKLYQRRQLNSLEAERVKSHQVKRDMKSFWDEQVKHKQKECENERVQSARFTTEHEKEMEKVFKETERQSKIKKAEKEVWLEGLKLQTENLKEKEIQEKRLKEEESKLMRFNQELQRIKEEQLETQEARKKRELSIALEKQHKAKLRNSAFEVQRELEEDKKLLDGLFTKENVVLEAESRKRENLKSDVEWMKSILDAQMKLEKEREAEIHLLYQEEAEKMWQKRESEWERERNARHKLLIEVVEGLKTQVDDKISRNCKEQANAAEEREKSLRDWQQSEKQLAHDHSQALATRENYKQDLLTQITENRLRKSEEKANSPSQQQVEPRVCDTKPLPGLLAWQ